MKSICRSLPVALLILLYAYAACSKLADIDTFRGQLYNQPVPRELARVLLYAVPLSELLCIGLLLFAGTVRSGLYLSLGLLLTFTAYIALVLLHYWDRIPCSCGGILSHMTWRVHLLFNLCFIVLNLIAIKIQGDAENLQKSRPHFL